MPLPALPSPAASSAASLAFFSRYPLSRKLARALRSSTKTEWLRSSAVMARALERRDPMVGAEGKNGGLELGGEFELLGLGVALLGLAGVLGEEDETGAVLP